MRAFSPLHGGVIAGMAVVVTALVAAARRWPEPARKSVGWVGLVLWVVGQCYYAAHEVAAWDLGRIIPLQVCDVVGLSAPLALLSRNRWWMAATWFAGWGLSSQTLLTPVVEAGPAELEFWLFWGMHGTIFAAAAMLVGAFRYRPAAGDFGRAWLASLGYVGVVASLDAATGWNYGYLGDTKPEAPTIIDHLGPWPWRLITMSLLATLIYLALWLPFAWLARKRGGGPSRRQGVARISV